MTIFKLVTITYLTKKQMLLSRAKVFLYATEKKKRLRDLKTTHLVIEDGFIQSQ